MKNFYVSVLFLFFLQVLTLNGISQTTISAGNVEGHWTLSGSPYNITGGDITVPQDTSLIIDPGVTVDFQGHYKLIVIGQLLAEGTQTDSIIFTANNVNTGWAGIRFLFTTLKRDTSVFEFCKVQYGKANGAIEDANGGGFYLNTFSKIKIENCRIANDSASMDGGGIYCFQSSPLINSNVIANCASTSGAQDDGGGGICCNGSSPLISNDTIKNCSANTAGGGIYCFASSAPVITNNKIIYNSSISASGSGGGICTINSSIFLSHNIIKGNNSSSLGGGIYISTSVDTSLISNNSILYNDATIGGGGVYLFGDQHSSFSNNNISNNTSAQDGGGVYSSNSSDNLVNDTISNNAAALRGGGIFNLQSGGGKISDCVISNNLSSSTGGGIYSNARSLYVNDIICNNASPSGGGIYFDNDFSAISNCTISSNNSTGSIGGGGICCFASSKPVFKNDIFYGNTISGGDGKTVLISDTGSRPAFSYCDVQYDSSGIFMAAGNIFHGIYLKNINSDPLFISPSTGAGAGFNGLAANWALQSGSPCIDKGTPDTSGLNLPSTDISGNPRINICRIDMGAFEYQEGNPLILKVSKNSPRCYGDSTGNAAVSISGGGGPYTYSWSNGQTDTSITDLKAGVYTLSLSESVLGCAVVKVIDITQPSTLTFKVDSIKGSSSCGSYDGKISISASGGISPYSYSWSPGSTGQNITGLHGGLYTVAVSDANGCSLTSPEILVPVPNLPAPSICMVTVDDSSRHNLVIWNGTNIISSVDSFVIYRETSTNHYERFGAVPKKDLSEFLDTSPSGNPNNSAFRYKLQAVDSCGNYSPLSLFHQTIFIQQVDSQFIWSQGYAIEGDTTTPVNNYVLMRDDSSKGNWHPVDSTSGELSGMQDKNYTQFLKTASWRVQTEWGISCTPTYFRVNNIMASYSTSKSNIRGSKLIVSGIKENQNADLLQVFPVPASKVLNILYPLGLNKCRICIFNMLGEIVYESESNSAQQKVDISRFSSGIYTLTFQTESVNTFRRLVVQ